VIAMSDTSTTRLLPADLPPLSDAAAVEILEFLHELVFRFEAHCFAQLRRCYDQRLDLFEQTQHMSPIASLTDDDVPF
jgi:hypothetical protein